jgi:O-antigen/teichoic acid export membrane protein
MSEPDSIAASPTDAQEAPHAGRWTLVSRVFAQASQLIVFLFAVRFLSPAEFGLFALVQATSVILFIAASAGWREVIVSSAQDPHDIGQVATYALASGALLCIVGVVIAGGIEVFFPGGRASPLMALFAICVLAAPVSNAFAGMLVRTGRVFDFAASSIAAEVVGFVVTLSTLFAGQGVFALVFGKIAYQVSATALMWFQTRWFGPFVWRGPRTRLLVSTSVHILMNRSILFLQNHGATFVVGAFLGPASVGFYRAAERVVASVAELVMEPVRMIAWVYIRRAAERAGDGPGRQAYLAAEATRILPIMMMAVSPVLIGLCLVSHEVVTLVLGPEWAPAAPVAAILAISGISYVPGTVTEPLLSHIGQVKQMPRILLLNSAVTLVFTCVTGSFGLIPLALSTLASGLFSFITTLWIMQKYGGLSWRAAARQTRPVIVPLAAMVTVVLLLQWVGASYGLSRILILGLQVPVGAAVYVALLYRVRPDAVRQIVSL